MARITVGAVVLLLLSGCMASQPPRLVPASVRWVQYDSPTLGYSLSYPDAFTPQTSSDGSYVIFRQGRYAPLIIRFVDKAEGMRTGLWFTSAPRESIQLAGRPGHKYVYLHWDGPFGARMIAFVIPYRDKYLGVELRSNGDIDVVQDGILRSFALVPQR
jgi:hypothetical protein